MAQIEKGPVPLSIELEDTEVEENADILNFEGDVNIIQSGDGRVTITVGETGQFTGKMIDYSFISQGNVADKWLGFDDGGSATSDIVPMIIPQNATLVSITYINKDDGTDTDIEVYKNGNTVTERVLSWPIRNKRYAWKTDLNGSITFSQGDRMSIFARKIDDQGGDPVPNNVVVQVLLLMTSDIESEGGASSGI